MRITDIIWNERFAAKIESKHGIMPDEVEQVLFSKAHVRRIERGRVRGEHLYVSYGQTEAGRYLVVFFIRKRGGAAMPISAREMTDGERTYYHEHKKSH